MFSEYPYEQCCIVTYESHDLVFVDKLLQRGKQSGQPKTALLILLYLSMTAFSVKKKQTTNQAFALSYSKVVWCGQEISKSVLDICLALTFVGAKQFI